MNNIKELCQVLWRLKMSKSVLSFDKNFTQPTFLDIALRLNSPPEQRLWCLSLSILRAK